MRGPVLMLVSSDGSLVESVEEAANPIGRIAIEVVGDVGRACERVDRDPVAIVLVHLDGEVDHWDRVSGVTRLMRCITDTRRPIPTMVVSDGGNPEQERAFLRLGVAEYLGRPLDINRLSFLIEMLTIRARFSRPRPPGQGPDPTTIKEIWVPEEEDSFLFGSGTKMERLIEQVRRIAPQDTTILLSGATGTGKSRLAGVIHRLSGRRDEPILTINCGALSATLIEIEMFGHVKGAFTGADSERPGKFAAVGRGTLFLDEVDSLPLPLQAKLIRAVEERVFEPVGSNKTQRMEARLIAACNHPLQQEVLAGRFRSDLYYRLNAVGFELPTLEERRVAIPGLARSFMDEFASRSGARFRGIADEVPEAFRAYSWPGNIRELRNVIERAVALGAGPTIELDDLPDHLRVLVRGGLPPSAGYGDPGNGSLATSREQAERERIIGTLKKHGNNRLRAAADLGISRMTLYNNLRKLGISDLDG